MTRQQKVWIQAFQSVPQAWRQWLCACEDLPRITIGGLLLILLGYVYCNAGEPVDDALRHLVAYRFHYDYHIAYPWATLPSFDCWYLFDVFMGWMHRTFQEQAIPIVRTLSCLGFIGALWQMCKNASINWRVVIILAGVFLVHFRMELCRPAPIESILFLWAVALQPKRWYWHMLLGLGMASFYYLFFIYLIPLILVRRIYVVPLLLGLFGWWSAVGAEFFHVFFVLTKVSENSALPILESAPWLVALAGTWLLLLPVIYFWRKDPRGIVLIVWFLAANRVRYLETVYPLCLRFAQHLCPRVSRVVVLALFCYLLSQIYPTEGSLGYKGIVPANSKVFCVSMTDSFRTLYRNDVQIAPCMAAAWNDPKIVAAMKQGLKGEFDPDLLTMGFDYIIESSINWTPQLMHQYGSRLRLVSTQHALRVWRVSRP